MHSIGIERDWRDILVNIGDGHHASFVGGGGDKLQAFVDQLFGIHVFQTRFARPAVGQQVHREVINFFEVSIGRCASPW